MSPVRATLLLALLLAWPIGRAAGTTPELSPEEEEALAAREVVVRVDERASSLRMIAIADVSAPPAQVLDATMRVERLAAIGAVDAFSVYERSADRVGARVEASALGVRMAYHVLYLADRAALRVTYGLDPTRENDVATLEGSYDYVAIPGGTRIVNRASGDPGIWLPGFAKRSLLARSMREKLEIIRATAEEG